MTKTLADLYQEFPEHFKAGVENVDHICCQVVMAKHPDFKERFPSGREAKQAAKERAPHIMQAKFCSGRD